MVGTGHLSPTPRTCPKSALVVVPNHAAQSEQVPGWLTVV